MAKKCPSGCCKCGGSKSAAKPRSKSSGGKRKPSNYNKCIGQALSGRMKGKSPEQRKTLFRQAAAECSGRGKSKPSAKRGAVHGPGGTTRSAPARKPYGPTIFSPVTGGVMRDD
jgi:hypothetical protein